ncbi:PE_PGRS family protein [Mycobacterium tuberculosis]|nr:PE family protein [Mycobacterium tuberculosis]CKP25008.1 PE_PGRS family protein [Mycobacterium tuberculosis]CKY71432.1 PE_PGRS family protein [Mycobacterium tuberculosis]
MSLVIVAPETVAAAALDVARIGSSIGAANAAAAGSTTSVLAAGADEVSAAIATLFGSHAREYQAISTQVAARPLSGRSVTCRRGRGVAGGL